MLKRLLSAALAAILVFVPSLPALADCCDDFWSCVGTVATLGLSCKAQQIAAAIEGMKKLIAAVEATKGGFSKTTDDTAKQMKDDARSAGDKMKDDTRKSVEDIRKAMSDTEILTNKQMMAAAPIGGMGSAGGAKSSPGAALAPAGTGGTAGSAASAKGVALAPGGAGGGSFAAIKPADPARVAADLKRAYEWVQTTHTTANTKKAPIVSGHANEAQKQVDAKEASGRQIVHDQLFSPLDIVRGELEHILATILNPFDFSSVTKSVDQTIKLIQSRAPGTFDSMANEMSSEAKNRLDEGQKMTDDVKKDAQDSRKVADQAMKLSESRSQGDLDKLEQLIGKPPSSMAMVQPAGATGRLPGSSSVASAAFLKTQGTAKARAQALSTGLSSQWAATRGLLNLAPVAVTPAMENKVTGGLSKMFAGKSSADAKKTQQQLLDQARARFANDPKTLAAVEKYLQQKTTPLVPVAMAPIRR